MKNLNAFMIGLFLLATQSACAQDAATAWHSLDGYGENPGDLAAYVFVPETLVEGHSLVVALHGCGQSAEEFAAQSGWNELAKKHGFIVLYPEQQATNNIQRCFNWFNAEDIDHKSGEAASIQHMLEFLQEKYRVKPAQTFVSGFSAGGAMTNVLLSVYPDLFAGGAPVAGIPYRAATDLGTALSAMQGGLDLQPQEWGDRVREQRASFTGVYPRILVLQGGADQIVQPKNAGEIVEQWANLHGMDAADLARVDLEPLVGFPQVSALSLGPDQQQPLVSYYQITAMEHAYPVDPGDEEAEGGTAAPFAADVDWHATYWIAKWLGVID